MTLSLTELALAIVTVFCGAYLNGAVGFGMGMIASPVLVLINPVLVPVPVLVVGMLVTAFGMIRDRTAIEFRGSGWAIAGRFPGSAFGAMVVASFSPAILGLSIGISVLAGVAIGVVGRVPGRSPKSMFLAGLISGLMSTIAAIGAPPIVLMYQSAPQAERRAALALFFFAGTVISLAALLLAGAITREVLLVSATLVPAVVTGFAFGMYGPRARAERSIRLIALAVCTVAGIVVLVRSSYALIFG